MVIVSPAAGALANGRKSPPTTTVYAGRAHAETSAAVNQAYDSAEVITRARAVTLSVEAPRLYVYDAPNRAIIAVSRFTTTAGVIH